MDYKQKYIKYKKKYLALKQSGGGEEKTEMKDIQNNIVDFIDKNTSVDKIKITDHELYNITILDIYFPCASAYFADKMDEMIIHDIYVKNFQINSKISVNKDHINANKQLELRNKQLNKNKKTLEELKDQDKIAILKTQNTKLESDIIFFTTADSKLNPIYIKLNNLQIDVIIFRNKDKPSCNELLEQFRSQYPNSFTKWQKIKQTVGSNININDIEFRDITPMLSFNIMEVVKHLISVKASYIKQSKEVHDKIQELRANIADIENKKINTEDSKKKSNDKIIRLQESLERIEEQIKEIDKPRSHWGMFVYSMTLVYESIKILGATTIAQTTGWISSDKYGSNTITATDVRVSQNKLNYDVFPIKFLDSLITDFNLYFKYLILDGKRNNKLLKKVIIICKQSSDIEKINSLDFNQVITSTRDDDFIYIKKKKTTDKEIVLYVKLFCIQHKKLKDCNVSGRYIDITTNISNGTDTDPDSEIETNANNINTSKEITIGNIPLDANDSDIKKKL